MKHVPPEIDRKALKLAAEARGMKLWEVASLLRRSSITMTSWLNGNARAPAGLRERLEDALGVPRGGLAKKELTMTPKQKNARLAAIRAKVMNRYEEVLEEITDSDFGADPIEDVHELHTRPYFGCVECIYKAWGRRHP